MLAKIQNTKDTISILPKYFNYKLQENIIDMKVPIYNLIIAA